MITCEEALSWLNKVEASNEIKARVEVAILKEIPRKPVQYEIHKQWDVELCPCCRSIVRNSEYISLYCPDCGQKIDWSEDD